MQLSKASIGSPFPIFFLWSFCFSHPLVSLFSSFDIPFHSEVPTDSWYLFTSLCFEMSNYFLLRLWWKKSTFGFNTNLWGCGLRSQMYDRFGQDWKTTECFLYTFDQLSTYLVQRHIPLLTCLSPCPIKCHILKCLIKSKLQSQKPEDSCHYA